MRIALVADEAAGAQALRRIASSDHDLALVLAGGRRTKDDDRRVADSVGDLARQLSLEVGPAARVRDPSFAAELRARRVDVLLNVHALFVVHPEVLAAPSIGAFNLHPGPLPEYSGMDTVSWALYEGAKAYGATLHWMTPAIDAGPIAYASRFAIDDTMSAARLMARSVREGLVLIESLLRQLAIDPRDIPALTQDRARRRYYARGAPPPLRIDWSTQTAAQVVGLVRACDYEPFPSPWGRPRAGIAGSDVEITRAVRAREPSRGVPGQVGHTTAGGLLVAAKDEWVEVQQVHVGGATVAGAELVKLATSGLPS